jgi:hypothetical protein
MEEVASTPKLVDPADVDAKSGLTATLPRSDIETALKDEAGADLFLEIARIQNGERDDRTVKVTWSREELEDLLRRASGDAVTLTFSQDELQRLLDDDVEAHGLREKIVVLSIAAATAASFASASGAQVMNDGGGGTSGNAAGVAMVTDASTGGIAGSVSGITTDASTSGTAADAAAPAAAPADGWMSSVESPVPGPAGINVVTDNTGGQPGSVAGFATDATTSGQPGSVSGIISDTGSEATRTPAAPAVSGGGSGFTIPDSAIEGALAGGLALLITGAAFVTRTQRRRPSTA